MFVQKQLSKKKFGSELILGQKTKFVRLGKFGLVGCVSQITLS